MTGAAHSLRCSCSGPAKAMTLSQLGTPYDHHMQLKHRTAPRAIESGARVTMRRMYLHLARALQGATVLQLFPYGWKLPDGSVAREQVYSGMAEALHAEYVRWINTDAGDAHFRRCDGGTSKTPVAASGQISCTAVTCHGFLGHGIGAGGFERHVAPACRAEHEQRSRLARQASQACIIPGPVEYGVMRCTHAVQAGFSARRPQVAGAPGPDVRTADLLGPQALLDLSGIYTGASSQFPQNSGAARLCA